jgi:metallo-beta-lactamase family protein
VADPIAGPEVIFHGACRTVTGSCFEVSAEGSRVLVDCGMFQGPRTLEALNHQTPGFNVQAIDAVLLTHAHIDHSGLLPRLVALGYSGPIWCTRETAELLACMLPDAARIQVHDTERRNRRPDRADEPQIEPLYREQDAKQALKLLEYARPRRPIHVAPGISATFWNAGHILGSTSIELNAGGSKLLFSGDLGPDNKLFEVDPEGPSGLDHLFCESTYGDRDRPRQTILERRAALLHETREALDRGGNLLIPVFALERTQELLLDFARLINDGDLPGANIFVDSPLASRITDVFARHAGHLEDTGGSNIFRHPAIHYLADRRSSRRVGASKGAIILAASGMCEGGRIRYHLQDNLPDGRSTVLFVGFQAQGTLGRIIQEGARRVRISGTDVAVRAKIRTLEGYSAHADRTELIAWVRARMPVSGTLFLTHGEPEGIAGLETALASELGSIVSPRIGEAWRLPRAAPAVLLRGARAGLPEAIGKDWQNAYADFAVKLRRDLLAIPEEAERQRAIREMRAILESYRSARAARTASG